jgi:guanyl-specific ribonuclease Sa
MHRQTSQLVKLIVAVVIVALALFAARNRVQDAPQHERPAAEQRQEDSFDKEIAATLTRIDAGERLRFRHDGAVFENRERRLPRKPAGYYREWVHPTPGVDGPGARRIVTGENGEAWYTPDHYQTFEKLR